MNKIIKERYNAEWEIIIYVGDDKDAVFQGKTLDGKRATNVYAWKENVINEIEGRPITEIMWSITD